MGNAFLETPIEFLKGVGAERAKTLASEARIKTFGDLLNYFPFRYVDRSKFTKVRDLRSDMDFVQVRGKIVKVQEVGAGKAKRLVAMIKDASGMLELVWFRGQKFVKPKLTIGVEFVAFGKPAIFGAKWNIAHPEIEEVRKMPKLVSTMEPVYHSSEGLTSRGLNAKGMAKLTLALVPQLRGKIPEVLPEAMRNRLNLISREAAYYNLHAPQSAALLKRARDRMKFDELFFLQLQLLKQKVATQVNLQGHRFTKVGPLVNSFYKDVLPFDLTGAQKRVLKEIRSDMGNGKHMSRLLQGDVGSGKTLVALIAMLIALDNGFQAAIMAPTEILAIQHNETMTELLTDLDVKVGLLTGSTKVGKRRELHAAMESGELNILIGTHALLEDKVQFKNLGIAVIDEQHRFGVAQRAKLWRKNTVPPHVLVMTATPIPRTLAMTLYGDLDVSVIDELPPGRKQVKTVHRFDSSRLRVFGFMEEQIKLGRQVYVVYPLIKESEKMDYKDLMDGYESMSRRFPLPEYRLSIVHGQMAAAAKESEMADFAAGKTHIMVATTVIEVGVNVPNASVMVIESAERFGLSQLHQLRGRVGRGADQSFCLLMTGDKLSPDAKLRVETMVRTSDGFEIAEVDLELRGPGDITGTQQSGVLELNIADLVKDGAILTFARKVALQMLEEDPDLTMPKNVLIAQRLKQIQRQRPNWGRIS
jgi:ATP-dependent DNA helicase RecG